METRHQPDVQADFPDISSNSWAAGDFLRVWTASVDRRWLCAILNICAILNHGFLRSFGVNTSPSCGKWFLLRDTFESSLGKMCVVLNDNTLLALLVVKFV